MLEYLRNDLQQLREEEKAQAKNLDGTRGAIQYCEHLISYLENQYTYEPSITEDQLAEIVAGPGAKVVGIDNA
jgi:hypothetical protein